MEGESEESSWTRSHVIQSWQLWRSPHWRSCSCSTRPVRREEWPVTASGAVIQAWRRYTMAPMDTMASTDTMTTTDAAASGSGPGSSIRITDTILRSTTGTTAQPMGRTTRTWRAARRRGCRYRLHDASASGYMLWCDARGLAETLAGSGMGPCQSHEQRHQSTNRQQSAAHRHKSVVSRTE